MKITVAIDSFKGSLTTFQAGNAIAEAARSVFNGVEVSVCPLADGGEGTMEAIVLSNNGEFHEADVSNPLGKTIKAKYGIIPESKTAVIEMATAAGLTLIEEQDRNPLYTTTYGVGELIFHAMDKGCRKFIVGIGGSATNDGGVGMLQALGFEFLDENGAQIPKGAIGLKSLKTIKTDKVIERIKECEFLVACDVKNPLCGDNGCSYVFARQKGGTDETIPLMDGWMDNYASLTQEIYPNIDKNTEGTGAAGGLGFAFLAYLNGKMQSGIEIVINETRLDEHVRQSDIVITGEGRLDRQSVMGKAPIGVARLAKKYNKKVIAFSGGIGDGAEACNGAGIDAYFPILQKPCTLQEAMNVDNAYANLKATAVQVFNLIQTF
jgi:glycerate kinase